MELKHMRDYGIKVIRPWWVSLLLSFPIINLFYTLKLEINVTSVYENQPISGTFRFVRWKKFCFNRLQTIMLSYAVVDKNDQIHVSIEPTNENYSVRIVAYDKSWLRTQEWRTTRIQFQIEKDKS